LAPKSDGGSEETLSSVGNERKREASGRQAVQGSAVEERVDAPLNPESLVNRPGFSGGPNA